MSDLRIALVAEGSTDYELIKAALRAVLSRAFVLTLLQPEATRSTLGSGWGGVLKWCHATSQRKHGVLETDPTLADFDLIIIHLDVDVAQQKYADCGFGVDAMAKQWGWGALPCDCPCPPITATCTGLSTVLSSWLYPASAGKKTVFCLPAQSTGSWLAVAVLPPDHKLLAAVECNAALEGHLAQLPKKDRIKKSIPAYRQHADAIRAKWGTVKQLCSQAQHFEEAVLAVLQ